MEVAFLFFISGFGLSIANASRDDKVTSINKLNKSAAAALVNHVFSAPRQKEVAEQAPPC